MLTMEDITVSPEALAERTDLRELFTADAPTELEIGCGKGRFLLRQAQAHPDRNFLGIEWANEYFKYAADRMARWGVTNVRVMRTDARHFVIHRLADACLSALHVYHPDPWPKKRHHKRRLFNAEFVDGVVRVLQPGGRLAIQTDHAEYFGVIQSLLAPRIELAETVFEEVVPVDQDGGLNTNFEAKYLREGRSIHRLSFRRVSP